jgi:hypothetical protein
VSDAAEEVAVRAPGESPAQNILCTASAVGDDKLGGVGVEGVGDVDDDLAGLCIPGAYGVLFGD